MNSCIHGYGAGCGICKANNELDNNIRREQRRYEVARDVMAAIAGADWDNDCQTFAQMAGISVRAADALLAELERSDGA